jgi:murein L,D-transpeptidase YafK
MVHGKCKSAGCYAMTDAIMEEIYALAREAFAGGQDKFHVHAFPFRMTDENLARYANVKGRDRNPNLAFWQTLKQAYDYFEITRKPPNIEVCDRRYNVNVEWDGGDLDPRGACPRFRSGPVEPYTAVASFNQTISTVPAPRPAARPPGFQPTMNLMPRSTPAPTPTDDPIGRLIRQLAH